MRSASAARPQHAGSKAFAVAVGMTAKATKKVKHDGSVQKLKKNQNSKKKTWEVTKESSSD